VYCLDAKNGSLRWRYGTGSEIESSLIEDGGRFYFGTDDGRLLALLPDAPVPVKAVYLPAAIPANLQGFVIDPALQPYFVGKGYAHLDSPAALAQWISAQTAAGSPSVVVFGFAQIPSAILGENPADGPLRRYLESGGKVVWPGGIPNHYMFDDQGTLMSADPAVGEKLLDLKFIPFEDSGNYYSRATQAGRNWGMSSWLRICFSYVASDSNLTALASDEFGRVSAFVRKFHPRSGSGWVSYGAKGFGVPITDIELAMLERVAAYGID
jgi:hypothetical protein